MIEYLLSAAAIGASSSTLFIYFLNKRKQSDIFTIKSDGKSVSVENTDNVQSTLKKLKPNFTPPPQSPIIEQSLQQIDMQKVTGIVLEGSADIDVDANRIIINGNSTCVVSGQTLWIKSISVIQTSFSTRTKKYNTPSVVKEIPFVNFSYTSLDRVSVQGSGTIELHNLGVASNFDGLVNGSGDIIIRDVDSVKLTLQVKGSGDIKVEGNVTAEYYDVLINGSGDVKIRALTPIKNINKTINGSGDIKVYSPYSPVLQTKSPEMFI